VIWRESYSTKIVRDQPAATGPFFDLDGTETALEDGPIVTGPVNLWTEIEAWRKLVAEHHPTLLIVDCGPAERDLLDMLVPDSLKPSIRTTESDLGWREDRAIAAIQRKGGWPIAMIGPATEEALELFLSEL